MNREKLNQYGALILTAAMLIMTMAMATIPQDQAREAADGGTRATNWWNANWDYRHQIDITNADATTYVNITYRVDINTTNGYNFSHINADGTDIRFIANDQLTRLYHWVEYWSDANGDATVWVKVPSVAASTTTTIWLYYGNTAATSQLSNGSAVFSLFDDFDYDNYRDCVVVGLHGNSGGAIMEKQASMPCYTPDTDNWHEGYAKMIGLSATDNTTEGIIMAYGSYINTSYACILGMNNSDGVGSDWTAFTNVMVNHSASGADPDWIKAAEPDFMTDLAGDAFHRDVVATYGTGNNMTLFYSGLNATNWSINMAHSPIFDAAWTKYTSNPVLWNGTGTDFDADGCRKPVVWAEGETDFKMLYAGSNDQGSTDTWKIGYATSGDQVTWAKAHTWSVFNGSGAFGWDNKSVIPLDIHHDGTYYELLYAGSDWQNNWRIGIAFTDDSDFIRWDTWGGTVTLGDSGDWDGHDINYGTYEINNQQDPGEKWVVYHTGMNSTGNVSMGYAYVLNSTITNWGSWQNDGTGSTCYCVDDTGKLRVDWNYTFLERTVDMANVTVSVDYWNVTGDQNASALIRSSGDAWAARDYYSAEVASVNHTLYMLEIANAAETEHNQANFTITQYNQVLLNVYGYGSEITAYAEDMATNATATANVSDETLTSGEVGLSVTIPGTSEFDYFRVNNAVSTALSGWTSDGESYDDYTENTQGDTTGDGGIDTDADDDGDDDDYTSGEADGGFELDICSIIWIILVIMGILAFTGAFGAMGGAAGRLILGAALLGAGAFAYAYQAGYIGSIWDYWLAILGLILILADYMKLKVPHLKRGHLAIIGLLLIVIDILIL